MPNDRIEVSRYLLKLLETPFFPTRTKCSACVSSDVPETAQYGDARLWPRGALSNCITLPVVGHINQKAGVSGVL